MRRRMMAVATLVALLLAIAAPALGNGDGDDWDDMPQDPTTTTTTEPPVTTTTAPPTTTTTEPPTTTTIPVTTTTAPPPTPTTTIPVTTTTPPPPPSTTTTIPVTTTVPPPPMPDPQVTVEFACDTGLVAVLSNEGDAPAAIDVAVEAVSVSFSDIFEVGAGATIEVPVDLDPVDEDTIVQVSALEGEFSQSIDIDCVDNPTEIVERPVPVPTQAFASLAEDTCETQCCDSSVLCECLRIVALAVVIAGALIAAGLVAAALLRRNRKENQDADAPVDEPTS